MKKYAKVLEGKVKEVIMAEDNFFDTFVDSSPGTWLECSHTDDETMIRKHPPAVGDNYDSSADAFYAQQPYPSWTLNTTTFEWEPPVARPAEANEQDGVGHTKKYSWDEENTQWVFLRNYNRP